MSINTIESGFEYQAEQIFKKLGEDYQFQQEENKEMNLPIQTFADWLWNNPAELGKAFYEKFDEYAGIDEATEKYNL